MTTVIDHPVAVVAVPVAAVAATAVPVVPALPGVSVPAAVSVPTVTDLMAPATTTGAGVDPVRAGDPLVRVVKGSLAAEELAALTAVLLARAAAAPKHAKGEQGGKAQAHWQRLERRAGYSSPVSWHG